MLIINVICFKIRQKIDDFSLLVEGHNACLSRPSIREVVKRLKITAERMRRKWLRLKRLLSKEYEEKYEKMAQFHRISKALFYLFLPCEK